jgi:hypothetical protein
MHQYFLEKLLYMGTETIVHVVPEIATAIELSKENFSFVNSSIKEE